MMFELVNKNDPILKQECQKFDFSNPPFEPIEFAHNIIKFMYEKNALGIAAPQIGLPYNVFAMRGSPENFVCFNPRIVNYSTEKIYLDEGCLTFPNLIFKIRRPKEIRVRFQTPNSETITRDFVGMTARIFQHEFDHLNGILFTNRVNRYHREKAMKKS
jgi:peptide deformylase